MDILGGAEQVDEVRIVHDWSYDTEVFSADRFFLGGDAACFTGLRDPAVLRRSSGAKAQLNGRGGDRRGLIHRQGLHHSEWAECAGTRCERNAELPIRLDAVFTAGSHWAGPHGAGRPVTALSQRSWDHFGMPWRLPGPASSVGDSNRWGVQEWWHSKVSSGS
ncbi:hypothetical protein [Kitasatospora acidiphila]|uniref:hypothetical protein n=1 Tax=Kitasatospora acidiphila TaxID=2567942 RepID=UPI001E39FD4C|nr:hypothetical protein [Kitasatospora acidiphila]